MLDTVNDSFFKTLAKFNSLSMVEKSVIILGIAVLIASFFAICIMRARRKQRELEEYWNNKDEVYEDLKDTSKISIYKCAPLISVDPYGYECIIADFLDRHLFRNVGVTQKSGDYGADIIAFDDNGRL